MITETIFVILLIIMLTFLILTLVFQNQAFGAFTIILCLMLSLAVFPGIGGMSYQTGANITTNNSSTTIINVYDSYTNIYLAMTFILIVFYMSMNIINFRKEKKRKSEEDESV